MPWHDVDVKLPKIDLRRTDIVFDVKVDEATLGALHISRGAVVWFPAGNTYGHKLNLSKFAELMVDNGSRSETR